jgi:GntR family transcriptional regulator, histidine utilization repressor
MPETPPPRTWQTIRAEVLTRIRDRRWPPGAMIPNEADLALEFGCARATVNRALRDLASAGVLDRRRKAGTRVAEAPVRRAVLSIPLIRDEVAGLGQSYGYALLSRVLALPPPPIRAALALPPDTQALHVRALHLAGGSPFALEDRWINPTAAPGVLEADFTTLSANEWLVRHAPFTSGQLSFSAISAQTDIATQLACLPGTALFRLDRSTLDGTRPVTVAQISYRPGYRLDMVI